MELTMKQKPLTPELVTSWQKDPDTHNSEILQGLQPILRSSIRSYAQGRNSQAVKIKARTLAFRALKTYDPTKGASPATHLRRQLQPLTRYSAEVSQPIHIPEEARRSLAEMSHTIEDLATDLDREPTDTEIADRMGLSETYVKRLKRYGSIRVQDPSETLAAPSDDPGDMVAEWLYDSLGPLDQKIMRLKMGLRGAKILPNAEIAKKMNLSPGAISQRAAKIARQLEEAKNEL